MAALLPLDPLELEIGYGLIPLVDDDEGGDLLGRVAMVRRQMATELGLSLAPIRIRDNIQLGLPRLRGQDQRRRGRPAGRSCPASCWR